MRINFEEIAFANVFAFGQDVKTISLNSHPTTLFLGENGSGKSSAISDTLSFVLYGRAHRDINKGTITNTINEKKAWVQVKFSVGSKKCRVVRGIKPNIFEIWENEVLVPQKDVKSYQEYLERDIIRMNFRSFCQIVVLGKASFIPFMQLSGPERRTIIEDLLDIRVFSLMSEYMKLDVKTLNDDIEKVKRDVETYDMKILASERLISELNVSADNQIKEHETQIELLKIQLPLIDEEIKKVEVDIVPKRAIIEGYKARIKEFQDNQSKIREEVTQLQIKLNERTKLHTHINKLNDLRSRIDTNKEKTTQDFEFFKINNNCPVCTQAITQEFRVSKELETEAKVKEFETGLQGIVLEIEKANKKIKDFDEIQNKITLKNNEINEITSNIVTLQHNISNVNREIEGIHSKTASMDAQKSIINGQISSREVEINKLRTPKGSLVEEQTKLAELKNNKTNLVNTRLIQVNKKQVFDVATLLLKDTGIKARVIKQYLPVINQLINKYLSEMDLFINFEINEQFEETVKSRFRDEFKYNNFSEGQKLRIDLCLLWSWREIAKLRGGVSTNLVVFDEILNSSLDPQGVEDFMKVIKSQEGSNLFVISHRSNDMIEHFARTFKFSLKNNFSVIEEL